MKDEDDYHNFSLSRRNYLHTLTLTPSPSSIKESTQRIEWRRKESDELIGHLFNQFKKPFLPK